MFSMVTHKYDRDLHQVVYAKRVYDSVHVALGSYFLTRAEAEADTVLLSA